MQFHISFVDHGGRVFSDSTMVAISRQDAVEIARRIYRSGIGAGYQIWDGRELVHSEWLNAPVPLPATGRSRSYANCGLLAAAE